MKQFNKISFAVILACSASQIYANESLLDKVQFNKSDSVLSDHIFYQIGGGAGYMTPPTRSKSLKALEFGIGWQANLMCGNFDIKTTVKNQLNGATEGFKDLMGNVIDSAKGAVASLPAMIIQRANPQLYDILTNGVYQGSIDFNRLKTNCETMSKQLADYSFNGRWTKMADLESYKDIVANEPDAKKAEKQLEGVKGKDGKPWIGGQKKGGEKQEEIKLVEDVVKAGFNLLNNRDVLDEKAVSKQECNGATCQVFDTPKQAADFLTNIIGEQSISTCSTDCGPKNSSKPGVGLSPAIEEENVRTIGKLEQILNMDVPSKELLAELNSNTIPITRGLIETLREDPDVEVLSQRLSAEIATAKVMEKMLLARRSVLAGMREPYVAGNSEAQTELEKVLNKIDLEISQIKLEMDMQKSITNNTATVIFNNKFNREANVGNYATSYDSVDKRINDLNYGTPNEDENYGTLDINLSRKNIDLAVPTVNNVTPYTPSYTGSTGKAGSGKYKPIPPINGTAHEQSKALLRQFEGFISHADWDVNAQRLGYGSDTITKADGTVIRVKKGMTVTKEDAERDLERRTREFTNKARREVSAEAWDKLTPKAQAVLTSYIYNYGSLTKTESVINAARESARTGDMNALAIAIRNRQVDNKGVNARRRNQEADYILN